MAVIRPIAWALRRIDQLQVPKDVSAAGPPPDEDELARLCDTMFAYHKYLTPGARGIEPPDDMVDVSVELSEMARVDPERLWPILVRLVDRAPSHEILMWIAAGDVEDLVRYHGPRFLDRLESQARTSRNFHEALRGIWGWEHFPKEVRERLLAVLTPEWSELQR